MKICKKCNCEYKDEYSYCPKCGYPFDESLLQSKKHLTKNDLIRYVAIVLLVLVSIVCFFFPKIKAASIPLLLLAISLLPFIYTSLKKRYILSKKEMSEIKVIIPTASFVTGFIIFIIILRFCF